MQVIEITVYDDDNRIALVCSKWPLTIKYWCRALLIAWIWLYESNCNNHHVREVVIEMKGSYSNALIDISKPS